LPCVATCNAWRAFSGRACSHGACARRELALRIDTLPTHPSRRQRLVVARQRRVMPRRALSVRCAHASPRQCPSLQLLRSTLLVPPAVGARLLRPGQRLVVSLPASLLLLLITAPDMTASRALNLTLTLTLALALALAAFVTPCAAADALAPRLLPPAWLSHPQYPLSVFEASGAVVRLSPPAQYLIVAGGYVSDSALTPTSSVHALHVSARPERWTRLRDMPRPLTHCAQAVVADSLYLCGGFLGKAPGQSVSDCYVFSMSLNQWKPIPSLPVSVGGGAMVYIKPINALFYAGGMTREKGRYRGTDLPHTFMLSLHNLAAGWKRKADMPNPRNHMAAAVAASRYFFLGGQHSADEHAGNQPTVNEYVYWSDKWFTKAPLPQPLGHIVASTFSYWNGILVVGGVTNGRHQTPNVYYYDVRSDSWSLIGQFPRSVQSPVCGISNLRIHCATGLGKPGWAAQSFHRKLTLPLPVQ
ncbi:unnamed protein product, partial [Agarophyton chilense]